MSNTTAPSYRAVAWFKAPGSPDAPKLRLGMAFDDPFIALQWCKAANATSPHQVGEGPWFVQVAEWRELEMSDLT